MEKSNLNKLTLSSLIQRVKSQTPPFWKKIRALGVSIGLVGTALIGAKQLYVLAWLSEPLCEKMIVIGIVATTLSSITADTTKTPAP